jgi:hypothetical protein
VTDGDRIADALRSLDTCPPPAWLRATWAASQYRNGDEPGATLEAVSAADFGAMHEGIISNGEWPPLFLPGSEGVSRTPAEAFCGGLMAVMRNGRDACEWCPCGHCTPTGMPPALLVELRAGIAGARGFAARMNLHRVPMNTSMHGAEPWASMRRYLASDGVTNPRFIRAACVALYRPGGAWENKATWVTDPAEPCDPDGFSHYVPRMSDAAIALGVAIIGLDAGLLPVEVYAALAEGFAHPVPDAGTAEWEDQLAGYFTLNAERIAAQAVADGVPPWENDDAEGKIEWRKNNAITNDPCALCGKRCDPCGFDPFLKGTWALVCTECAHAGEDDAEGEVAA